MRVGGGGGAALTGETAGAAAPPGSGDDSGLGAGSSTGDGDDDGCGPTAGALKTPHPDTIVRARPQSSRVVRTGRFAVNDHSQRNVRMAAIGAAQGTPREATLVREQARLLSEQLFDEDGAAAAYLRLLELSPDDKDASAKLEEQESRRARHAELRASYLSEAEGASDEAYKSAMLMRAAEMDVRFRDTWLEWGGCGMIHPYVLERCGIDSERWQGFAFGMGIDRTALHRFGFPALRVLFEGDVRVLEQV